MAYAALTDLQGIMSDQELRELTNDGDIIGAVNNGAGYAIGAASVTFDGFDVDPVDGDEFEFGNHQQRYTLSGVTSTTANISPNLQMAVADNAHITLHRAINTNVLNKIHAEVADVIDSALRRRYDLPFASAPTLLTTIEKYLVKYQLYERRNRLSDALLELRKQNMTLLDDLASGKKRLDTSSELKRSDGGIAQVSTTADDFVFTKEFLDRY